MGYQDVNDLMVTSPADTARISNSTSSIFASATITNPDANQIILCMAAVLHVQMQHDAGAPQELKDKFSNFSDEMIRGSEGRLPTVDEIYEYTSIIYQRAKFSPECNIIALVYMNRVIALSGMPLGENNWRPAVLVAMILAQKVWDDKSLRASSFTLITPGYTKEQIKLWELRFLALLQYSGVVTQQLYTRYYFELRVLYETVHKGSHFPMKVLSMAQAKRMELVSSSFTLQPSSRRKKGHKKSHSSNATSSSAGSKGSYSSGGSGSLESSNATSSLGPSTNTSSSQGETWIPDLRAAAIEQQGHPLQPRGQSQGQPLTLPPVGPGGVMGGGRSGGQAVQRTGPPQPSPVSHLTPGQRTPGGSRAQTWEDITYVQQGRYVQS